MRFIKNFYTEHSPLVNIRTNTIVVEVTYSFNKDMNVNVVAPLKTIVSSALKIMA